MHEEMGDGNVVRVEFTNALSLCGSVRKSTGTVPPGPRGAMARVVQSKAPISSKSWMEPVLFLKVDCFWSQVMVA